jgi:hypothetical protein
VPELSYCIVLYPQVLGPADAGTALPTASANARARVILVNMLILLVWKPEVASAEGIEKAVVYFRAGTCTRLARYTSACGARDAQFTPLLSVPGMNASTILDLP